MLNMCEGTKFQAQYDELAPDWANVPERVADWAQWYVIDEDGSASYWEQEPITRVNFWTDKDECGKMEVAANGKQKIPVGIDWRACKWQRTQVQP